MSDSIRITPIAADTASWRLDPDEDFKRSQWSGTHDFSDEQNQDQNQDHNQPEPPDPVMITAAKPLKKPVADKQHNSRSAPTPPPGTTIEELPGEFFPMENIEETIERNTLAIDECISFAEVSVEALLKGDMSALEQSQEWAKADLEEFVIHVAAKYRIDAALLLRLIEHESQWNANQLSETVRLGDEAIGLMQIPKGVLLGGEWCSGGLSSLALKWNDGRPMTVEEAWTPAGNILAGVQLLANIRDTVGRGDMRRVLRYYVSGSTRPNPTNTAYLNAVWQV